MCAISRVNGFIIFPMIEPGEGDPSVGVGEEVGEELHCGREWVTVDAACGTRVAGLLPPSHPGSEFGQANENP